MQWTSLSRWSLLGLGIALLAIPAVVSLARLFGGDPPSDAMVLVRELSIFALAALLIWIVRSKEGSSLTSIGLAFDRPGRSVVRGLLLTLACFAILVAILALYSALGVSYGDGPGIARAWPLTLLTVLRAGIVEELFYRGFAIERLQTLTGSKWIAAGVSLIAFAAFHYRQGLAGIVIALVLGGALTAFYLWKRDLLAAIIAHFLVDFIPNVLIPAVSPD